MIRMTVDDSGQPHCEVDVRARVPVYLDNDCVIELAKGDASRRARFVDAIRRGGTLLFSLANAAEIAGPQGQSKAAVRAFLDSIGPYWAPLELNPRKVIAKEQAGEPERAQISEHFVLSYFQDRAYELSPGGSRVLDLSADTFFRLSAVVDWAQRPEADVRAERDDLDTAVAEAIRSARAEFDTDPRSLDRRWPPIPFSPAFGTTFVFVHLMRLLVKESKAYVFKPHDGLDLSHAVMAASTAVIATLDKQWKARVSRLPEAHQLAKVFYRPEVEQMVALLEANT